MQLTLSLVDKSRLKDQWSEELTCSEYFAGIGLVRLGLEQAGWNIMFANDWATEKKAMYVAQFADGEEHYQLENIFDLNPSEIPSTLLATASFPCIDLSLAGNLKGIHGKHSSAFWGFINILENQRHRPPLVLLENVTGWLTSNQGADFRMTIEALNQLGYACDVYTINAAHFVPQSRPRVFVVGIQAKSPQSNHHQFLMRDETLTSTALKKAVEQNLDLGWNFLNAPPLPPKGRVSLSSIVEELLETDDRWWSETEVERHLNMMSTRNLDYLETLRTLPAYSYHSMYRRIRERQQRAELRKDSIAGCLRTARGGSSRQMLVRAGRGQIKMRVMTPREYARLQGVPDSYPLPKTVNQALTGFGDAVCVPVIQWIAENILNSLAHQILADSLPVHSR